MVRLVFPTDSELRQLGQFTNNHMNLMPIKFLTRSLVARIELDNLKHEPIMNEDVKIRCKILKFSSYLGMHPERLLKHMRSVRYLSFGYLDHW